MNTYQLVRRIIAVEPSNDISLALLQSRETPSVITEFKMNVADVSNWRAQPATLRSMLGASYSQICIAYSMLGSQKPRDIATQYVEALFIGEALFDFCDSIFPIHVYQPGSAPTDHVVFILQIKDLDGFCDKLRYLGEIFDGNPSDEEQMVRKNLVIELSNDLDTLALHFPELREAFYEHWHAASDDK